MDKLIINTARKTLTVKHVNSTINIMANAKRGLKGEKGDTGSPATNLVTSVNNQQGDVILDANDVGADALGSATLALSDANDYTDAQVSSLDSEISTVGKTGDYYDLLNKPTIPIVDYPVTTVFGRTGDIVGEAGDYNAQEILASPSGSVQDVLNELNTNKEPTITAGTTSQYWRGDKTWQPTLDLPVSTAAQTALDLKQNSLGFTPENVVNKSTTTTLGISNTLYPTQNAVKTYIDTAITGVPLSNYVLKAGDTMTGALNTQSLLPTATATYGIGSPGFRYGTAYIGTLNLSNGTGVNFNTNANINIGTATTYVGTIFANQFNAPSSSTGIVLYNTVDQTTNYERFRQFWNSNVYTLAMESAGTGGVNRALSISAAANTITLQAATNAFDFVRAGVTGLTTIARFAANINASSGNQSLLSSALTVTQSGTAGYTANLTNVTETSTGSGVKLLHDWQVGGVSRLSIDNMGNITPADITSGGNIIAGTTNGMVIATTATQKLGFFGATPVVQATGAIDLGVVLSNLGFRAAGTGYSLGTSGLVAMTGVIRETPANITATTTLNTTSSPKNNRVSATGSTAINVTLPATTTAGFRFRFYRTDANAAVVTILGTINGNASGYVLSAQYKYVDLMSTTVSGAWEIWGNN